MASCSGVDLKTFLEYLDGYSSGHLQRLTEYFRPDMIYVIENHVVWMTEELMKNKAITRGQAKDYSSMDSTEAVEKMVDYFVYSSKEVALKLWEVLFQLKKTSSHPNLLGMVDEILYNGKTVLEEILLAKRGPDLDQEIKACHKEHRNNLLHSTCSMKEVGREQDKEQTVPLLSRFVDIKMVSDKHFMTVNNQEHEALAGELNEYHLRRKTQREMEQITADRLFRWCFHTRHTPCTVMVVGVAGVGKSTLMQKFVFDWAKGTHHQKFAFIFFFKFRDLNSTKSNTSLKNLIECEYPRLRDKLEVILQNPEKLLFIFDGLDESRSGLDLSRNHCVHPSDLKPVSVIISSLLKQTLLKGCSVLLTSRPSQLLHLETGVFQRIVTIVGFLSREREWYFNRFFDNKEVGQQALAYVRESQVLYTLCYNPSYCWITCTALRFCFDVGAGQPSRLPKTVTQLFVSYIQHMLRNHAGAAPDMTNMREMLRNLAQLADQRLAKSALIFSKNCLETFHLNESLALTSFLTENIQGSEQSEAPPKRTFSFIHLTLQEFFAALSYYVDYSEDHFNDTLEEAEGRQKGKYEIFCRFLCGLCHPATREPLEEVLGKFSAPATKRVIDWVCAMRSSAFLRMGNQEHKRAALNYFSLLFEAQNTLLVQQVIGDKFQVDFSTFHLLPVDCTILAYILSCCKMCECLNLDSCLIEKQGMEKLGPYLHKVRDLRLCDNNLGDEAMKHLLPALGNQECQLQSLSLGRNPLSDDFFEGLSSALSNNQTLSSLDLSKTKLRQKGISHLLDVFRRMQKLIIRENCLSDELCGQLCDALLKNVNLTHLDLSCNPLTDGCVNELHYLIVTGTKLQEIRLHMTDISTQMEDHLKAQSKPGLSIYF